MSVVNPYAIPEANLDRTRASSDGCWRIGKDVLFVSRNSDLPHRCVKCNAPARVAKTRTYYWHSPWYYLLILAGLLFYAIVVLIARKKVEIAPALCDDHDRRRVNNIWYSIGSLLGGIVLAVVAGNLDSPFSALFLVIGAIFTCFYFANRARIVTPVGIDDRGARFKGCGTAFLDSLEATRPY